MLDKLLESRAHRGRSATGVAASVCAHTALIAAAVYATAQARSAPTTNEVARQVYYVPSKELLTQPSSPARPATTPMPSHERPILRFFDVPTIDVTVPSLDMSNATTTPSDFGGSGIGPDPSDHSPGGGALAGQPLRADQVERQVEMRQGNAAPIYPPMLREAGVEGKVIATFVVNEQGWAEDSTVSFSSSDNPLFEEAVRLALKRMRFTPAEVGGRKVRQLVQMPFMFTLRK
jgi:periplasmic protein TonB